ncbi:hypothetical protein [Actinophytocola sp.]|uniref:hypothetical protein n=1 Tax=Actinophytocola sp. TaxID=1872138 RepID=UPI002D7FB430|nr:hypothetical protein [Actinophytocola sp.]HET9142265.1 hypothetical protein [Actinophytocola sp.]HEU5107802.1 hypothetical protein [Micromonosporaceae bacterium]
MFTKGAGRDYWCHVHRPDGAVVFVPSFDRKHRVPHDLAHVATESALGIEDGVFGSIMAGALMGDMRVVSGGRRHDARQRSEKILRANTASRALTVAEVLAAVVHDAVESGKRGDLHGWARRHWGSVRQEPFPYTAAQLAAARRLLEELAARWAELPAEGELEVDWRRAGR